MDMHQVFQDFITALRQAGVRISVAEHMDAIHALKKVGYGDRTVLKNALGSTLAKSIREAELFETCFERFFSVDDLSGLQGQDKALPEDEAILEDKSSLTRMLMTGDIASLNAAMRSAAENSNIREILLFTQKGRFMRGILNSMGIDGLEQDMNRLASSPGVEDRQRARELVVSKSLLMNHVRDFVEKQYALFAGSVSEEILERFLKDAKLSNVEQRDFQRMQVLIKKLVKRLNDLHSRRKKVFRKGLLDLKKTLRVNMAYQGIIMEPQWKTKKVDRPDIVAICDVSRSVENVVRFFLMFLYSLNDSLARVRSFAFCTNLVEVTHVFENYPIEEALNRVLKGIEIDLQFASTDYGAAFATFREKFLDKVSNKTTILILGDARNNFGKPNTDILRLMQERSKRIVWLNPEQRSLWGTGDSEMRRYAPYCFLARECNTVNHIQRVIDFLLRTRQ
jgi:hypothetical protein